MLLGILSFYWFVAGFLIHWLFIVLSLILVVFMGYIDEWALEFAFTVGMFVARQLLFVFCQVRLYAPRTIDEDSTHIRPSTSQQLTEEAAVPDSQSRQNDFMPGLVTMQSIGDIDTGQTIPLTHVNTTDGSPLYDATPQCEAGLTHVLHSQEIPACSEYDITASNGRPRTRKKSATVRTYCTNLHGRPPDKVRRRVIGALDSKTRLCEGRAQINFVTGKAPVCNPELQELVLELCKQRGFHAFIGCNGGVIICELVQATEMNTSVDNNVIDDKPNANCSLLPSPKEAERKVSEASCGDDLVSVLSQQDDVCQEMPSTVPILNPDPDSVDIRRLSPVEMRSRVVEALQGVSSGANPTQIIFITGKRRESKCKTRKIVRDVCREMGFIPEFHARQRDILCDLVRELSEDGTDTGWNESTTTMPEVGDRGSFSDDEAESLVRSPLDEDELTSVVQQRKLLQNSHNDIDHMSEDVMGTQTMPDVELSGLNDDEVRIRVTEALQSAIQAGNSTQITFHTGKNTRRKHKIRDFVRKWCEMMKIRPDIRTIKGSVICELIKDRLWRYPNTIPMNIDLWKSLLPEPRVNMCQIFAPMMAERRRPGRKQLRWVGGNQVDLHGLSKGDATVIVERVLADPPALPFVEFITGRGLHSKSGVSVLRPHVLKLCRKKGFRAWVDPMNEGMVLCCLH